MPIGLQFSLRSRSAPIGIEVKNVAQDGIDIEMIAERATNFVQGAVSKDIARG